MMYHSHYDIDPNQLPPTVISQMATKYQYDQSLFMRLQKSAPDNVYLLRYILSVTSVILNPYIKYLMPYLAPDSIQYRMHPAISVLPSKLFYNSLLHDAPGMDTVSAAPWHSRQYFPPYQFYNVEDGQERTGAGRSLYNPAEAEAAVALVDMLATQMPQLKVSQNTYLAYRDFSRQYSLKPACLQDWCYHALQAAIESAQVSIRAKIWFSYPGCH